MPTAFICATCGTQHAPSEAPPARCAICCEERQYVLPTGQQWTDLPALARSHSNCFKALEPNLLGIGTHPHFAIGQRALLLRTPAGNVLWDCVSLLDEATVEIVRALGGLATIAISHPHYYTTMIEWAEAFDARLLLHARDAEWIMRPHERIEAWQGETLWIGEGLTLVRAGGHFAGGTVLHWTDGAQGLGALLAGDLVMVTPDCRSVSFMRSYPNMLPLGAAAVRGIARRLAPWNFERIYSAFWDRVLDNGAKAAVDASVTRYVRWVESGDEDPG